MSQSNSAKISILFTANLVNFLISFLLVPFLSRRCTYEEYGTYSQVILFGAFSLVIFNVGISTVSNVVLAENEKKASIVFNTATNILGAVSIAGALLILLVGKQWDKALNNPNFFSNLIYYVPVLMLQSISSYFLNTALFYNKVKAIAVIVVSTNIFKMAMMLFSLYILKSMEAIYVSMSVFTFLQCALLFFSLPHDIRKLTFRYDKNIARQLFVPAIPIMFTGLLGSGILYVNGFFISNMLSVKDYAVYRNGAIEFPLVSVVTASIMSVTMPVFAKLKVKGEIDEMLALRKRAGVIAAALIFPACVYLFFFSKEFIVLYLSDKYVESSLLFSIFNIALLLRFCSYQDLLILYKKTRLILMANLFSFCISVIMNYFFIKNWGLMGAVIAYLFSLFSLGLILTLLTCKIVNISIADYQDWLKIFKILMISFLTGSIFYILYKYFETPFFLGFVSFCYFGTIIVLLIKLAMVDKAYIQKYIGRIPGLNKFFLKDA